MDQNDQPFKSFEPSIHFLWWILMDPTFHLTMYYIKNQPFMDPVLYTQPNRHVDPTGSGFRHGAHGGWRCEAHPKTKKGGTAGPETFPWGKSWLFNDGILIIPRNLQQDPLNGPLNPSI